MTREERKLRADLKAYTEYYPAWNDYQEKRHRWERDFDRARRLREAARRAMEKAPSTRRCQNYVRHAQNVKVLEAQRPVRPNDKLKLSFATLETNVCRSALAFINSLPKK